MSTTVQCPCGQSFERQPQRGRPAVWCPKCRALPMNQRVARPVETEDGEPVEYRVSRYGSHDPLSYEQRERVEEGVQEVYARFEEIKETIPQNKRGEWVLQEVTAVYNAVDSKRWPLRMGGEEES